MATLLTGIALFVAASAFIPQLRRGGLVWHYFFIVGTVAVFMFSHTVFGFFNMQYEIREVFVVLAALHYFVYLTQRWKRNAGQEMF